MSRFILASLATALLCACATAVDPTTQFEEPEYTTGSNLSRRDRSPENVTRSSKESMDSFQRSTGPIRGPDGTR